MSGPPSASTSVDPVPCSDPNCALRSDAAAHCWVEPLLHCHRPVAAGSFGELYRRDCCDCHAFGNLRQRTVGRRRADDLAVNVIRRLGREVGASGQALSAEAESLASLGETAAQVLHGLENALGHIAEHARTLREDGRSADPGSDAIRGILDEVDRAEETIAALLCSGGFAGRPPEAVDPRRIVALAAEREGDAFRRSGVRLDERVPVDVPAIMADPDRILLAVRTVLQNARAATPRGGCVRLLVGRDDGQVVFQVEDSGPGIPEEGKARACDAGYTTKGDGTGLGLWLVRRVIQRHGGHVDLADAPEGGLVVSLRLPLAVA